MIRIVATYNNPHEAPGARYQALLADGRWIMLTRERWYWADRGLLARGAR